MSTEDINPNTADIDRLSALEIVQRINAEDRTVADAVAGALPQIAAAVAGIVARLGAGGRMFYVGAGTSGRLGVLDAVESVPTFSTPPEMIQAVIAGGHAALTVAVEGAEDDADLGAADLRERRLASGDVVVGIAASGRTPYVLGALAYARSTGALTIGLACNAPAPLLQAADLPIAVPVGPEVISGSTRMKAGTAQKMVLNMLSSASMIQLGKVYGNLMVDVQVTNQKLAQRARRIVAQISGVSEDEAARLLNAADQRVKVALVMQQRGVDAEQARALLDAAGGFLRRVIDAE